MTGSASAGNVRNEFNYFDQNKDSLITFEEFSLIILEEENGSFHQDFSELDQNNDGSITFGEAKKFDISIEEFNEADNDKSGKVSLKEFSGAMLNEMFQDADQDHNKTVDYSEFKRASEEDS
jgi:Ca2+-binding EF-hand superfamily protein